MLSSVVRLAETATEDAPLIPAWVVGGGILAVLLLLLAILVIFGAGREHS
ncbi:MAG: hypothetical protein R2734_16760 [Nocardioides sp.]